MNVLGYINETSTQAKLLGLPTGYLDAKQDIEAALDYLYKLSKYNTIILFGSSYSASLCLLIAATSTKVKAVITYSPGEYLKGIDLCDSVDTIIVPVHATAAKKEMDQVKLVLAKIDPDLVNIYHPRTIGAHGSRVLWDKTAGNIEYWQSLIKFLDKVNYLLT